MKKRKPKWTAARILALRDRLGLTQGQFAARLSRTMTNQAVSRWESGRASPSPLYVDRLDELERAELARQSAEDAWIGTMRGDAGEKGEAT